MNVHYIEIVAVVFTVGVFLLLALLYRRTETENLKLREDLAVAKIRLEHKAEEIEHLHGEIEFQKKMRAHADEFIKQVQSWILSEPDLNPKPKGFHYFDPETFEVKWKPKVAT